MGKGTLEQLYHQLKNIPVKKNIKNLCKHPTPLLAYQQKNNKNKIIKKENILNSHKTTITWFHKFFS